MRHGLIGSLCLFLIGIAAPAGAAEPPRLAVFDFTLIDTSPAPPSAAEKTRLARLGDTLRRDLAQSGRYRIVAIAPLHARIASGPAPHGCISCARSYARQLGATLAAYGWVQKVSDLILNINLVIEDAGTGRVLRQGSVDIRGNTDETWNRGLRYLLQEWSLM